MEWKYDKPLAYRTGQWDGKMSDQVLAQDKDGKNYLASLYKGTMDGCEFEDWLDNNDYIIREEIVRYLQIPD